MPDFVTGYGRETTLSPVALLSYSDSINAEIYLRSNTPDRGLRDQLNGRHTNASLFLFHQQCESRFRDDRCRWIGSLEKITRPQFWLSLAAFDSWPGYVNHLRVTRHVQDKPLYTYRTDETAISWIGRWGCKSTKQWMLEFGNNFSPFKPLVTVPLAFI